MIDILKSSIKNLGRKRFRSFLTILGICIGVTSVIIIGNISEIGTSAINKEMDSLGLGGLTISTSNNITSTSSGLNKDDLEIVRHSDNIKQAMPIVVNNSQIICRDEKEDALLWGIDSKANQIISLNVLFGRGINATDVNSYSNVCLVDEGFAQRHYKRNNIVGKKIFLKCSGVLTEFEVVGIIKTGSSLLNNILGEYIPNFIYVPYTTLQSAANIENFSQIAVKVSDGCDVDMVGDNLVRNLTNSNSNKTYYANNLIKQKDSLQNILNILTLVLSAVGAISLLVASLSIMTVMLVSVNERTREIGIKKSIGAKRKVIMFEFLLEATLISLIGCIAGVIIGNMISLLGAISIGMSLKLRLDIMIIAVTFSLFSGIIFGVYPAAKASNLKPVDALRNE